MTKMHLSLNVKDLERSVRFYEAFLGTAPRKRHPGYANFDVSNPPLRLALVEKPDMAGGDAINHLGILVPSTLHVDAAKQRLIDSGLATFSEEDTTCCYAVQNKVWAHDPDGNAWEVYTVLDEVEGSAEVMSLAAPRCCS